MVAAYNLKVSFNAPHLGKKGKIVDALVFWGDGVRAACNLKVACDFGAMPASQPRRQLRPSFLNHKGPAGTLVMGRKSAEKEDGGGVVDASSIMSRSCLHKSIEQYCIIYMLI